MGGILQNGNISPQSKTSMNTKAEGARVLLRWGTGRARESHLCAGRADMASDQEVPRPSVSLPLGTTTWAFMNGFQRGANSHPQI